MKKIMYGLSITLSALLISGCGGDGATEGVSETVKPHKLTRAVPLSQSKIKLDITNDSEHIKFKFNKISPHSQVYIDIDQNNASGYTAFGADGVGAEYLIEDSVIFEYTGGGGYDWSWQLLYDISQFEALPGDPSTGYQAALPYYYFIEFEEGGMDMAYFDAQAVTFGDDWLQISRSDKVAFPKDPNEDRRGNIASIGMFGGEHMIANDYLNTYLYSSWYPIKDGENNTPVAHYQYFIDLDVDVNTGYKKDITNPWELQSISNDLGAEYFVENGYLFKYTGSGGYDWSWEIIGQVNQEVDFVEHASNEQYNYYEHLTIVPKNMIPNWTDPFKIAVTSVDENWEQLSQTSVIIYSFSADDTIYVYKPKGSLQCDENSGIPLEEMQLELTAENIPVLGMETEHDGVIRPTLCGADTGEINVYRTYVQYYETVRSLGFTYLR